MPLLHAAKQLDGLKHQSGKFSFYLLACFHYFLMAQGLIQDTCRHIGDAAYSGYRQTAVIGGDHFRHSGHSDRIGASVLAMRISAGVSKLGPLNSIYTPFFRGIQHSTAAC